MKNISVTTILVCVSCLLFIIHQYLQLIAEIAWPFVDNYLDPLLMMPIVLHAVVWEKRLLHKDHTVRLPAIHIFSYFILTAFIAETLFPLLSNKFTADPFDTISYAMGSFVYYLAQLESFSKNDRA